MAAAIKMDELLVSWLGSDVVYENVQHLIENRSHSTAAGNNKSATTTTMSRATTDHDNDQDIINNNNSSAASSSSTHHSPRGVIPPFYSAPGRKSRYNSSSSSSRSLNTSGSKTATNLSSGGNHNTTTATVEVGDSQNATMTPPDANNTTTQYDILDTWLPQYSSSTSNTDDDDKICVRDQVLSIFHDANNNNNNKADSCIEMPNFVRITKDICHFPTFFNGPLYQRILLLWNTQHNNERATTVITMEMMEWFYVTEMEPYDASERFFRLLKQPNSDHIARDDFLIYIKELLNDHPGLEFLSNHAEFQEKYAVTVISRIFYSVNRCHSGRITCRQVRRSNLLQAFHLVDEEEDINKVTQYFSYEHFYVLYCRFWELDHDRDYRITREDLLKYGDHSLSHMIVDRIFEAAPRPFESSTSREYLSYEDFIFFMLSEEDKANEVSVRYWFSCVDVDGDGKLNNMEMRSFYAVQLHRMQCMGHEIVPFEDMLCQMMDMIKPANTEYLVVEDFLQPECAQVSGALFDALFNLNKYLMFEQRDPFVERQKREDEFETDWDRFACIDYNRLAMEEEAREEEAMDEVDWVTVDDEEEGVGTEFSPGVGSGGGGSTAAALTATSSEAPF